MLLKQQILTVSKESVMSLELKENYIVWLIWEKYICYPRIMSFFLPPSLSFPSPTHTHTFSICVYIYMYMYRCIWLSWKNNVTEIVSHWNIYFCASKSTYFVTSVSRTGLTCFLFVCLFPVWYYWLLQCISLGQNSGNKPEFHGVGPILFLILKIMGCFWGYCV